MRTHETRCRLLLLIYPFGYLIIIRQGPYLGRRLRFALRRRTAIGVTSRMLRRSLQHGQFGPPYRGVPVTPTTTGCEMAKIPFRIFTKIRYLQSNPSRILNAKFTEGNSSLQPKLYPYFQFKDNPKSSSSRSSGFYRREQFVAVQAVSRFLLKTAHLLIFMIQLLLLVSGDVEPNPGPSAMRKQILQTVKRSPAVWTSFGTRSPQSIQAPRWSSVPAVRSPPIWTTFDGSRVSEPNAEVPMRHSSRHNPIDSQSRGNPSTPLLPAGQPSTIWTSYGTRSPQSSQSPRCLIIPTTRSLPIWTSYGTPVPPSSPPVPSSSMETAIRRSNQHNGTNVRQKTCLQTPLLSARRNTQRKAVAFAPTSELRCYNRFASISRDGHLNSQSSHVRMKSPCLVPSSASPSPNTQSRWTCHSSPLLTRAQNPPNQAQWTRYHSPSPSHDQSSPTSLPERNQASRAPIWTRFRHTAHTSNRWSYAGTEPNRNLNRTPHGVSSEINSADMSAEHSTHMNNPLLVTPPTRFTTNRTTPSNGPETPTWSDFRPTTSPSQHVVGRPQQLLRRFENPSLGSSSDFQPSSSHTHATRWSIEPRVRWHTRSPVTRLQHEVDRPMWTHYTYRLPSHQPSYNNPRVATQQTQQQSTHVSRRRRRSRADKAKNWRTGSSGTRNASLIKVVQVNADGLTRPTKLAELSSLQADIIAVQETKWNQGRTYNLEGYSCIHKPRTVARQGDIVKGGGVAIFVKHGLMFSRIDNTPIHPSDLNTEWCGITVSTEKGDLQIYNLYCPPIRTGNRGDERVDNFDPSTLPANSRTIILGDFNAHHELWDAFAEETSNGEKLFDWLIDNPNMQLLNDGSPTHRLRGSNSPSVPDLSFASSDLNCIWQTQDPIGSSDHNTIAISVVVSPAILKPPVKPTKLNISKADWPKYRETIISELGQLNRRPRYKDIHNAINTAAKASTPVSTPCRRPTMNWFDSDCRQAVKRRNDLAKEVIIDPNKQQEYVEACITADKLADKKKEAAWIKKANEFNLHTKPSELFQVIRAIEGKGTTRRSQEGIKLPDGKVVHGKNKAQAYASVYASWSKIDPSKKRECRSLKRKNRKILKSRLHNETKPMAFTARELDAALHSMNKGKASGPDNIVVEHLLNLPESARNALLLELSRLILSGESPREWRMATVVPLLKPGKTANKLDSYRPVSLTSVIAKLAERLVLNRLQPIVNDLLSPEQLGFRPHRSSEDALAYVCQNIYEGLESKNRLRTTLACMDFRKAFDSVPHPKLLEQLLSLNIPAYLVRWIRSFLNDRRIQVRFEGLSTWVKVPNGLPQGSVLSPVLFTLYLDSALDKIKSFPDVNVIAYADDLTLWSQDRNAAVAAEKLQPAITDGLEDFCDTAGMKLAPEKCTYSIFSLDSSEADLEVELKIGDRRLSRNKEPKLLGIVLDRTLGFQPFTKTLVKDLHKRLAAVSAVSGMTWGQRENSLRTLFKAFVEAKAGYAAGVWGSFASDTNLNAIQKCLNRGARVITGCCRSTPIGPLLAEADIPTIRCLVDSRAACQVERASRTTNHVLTPYTTPVDHHRRLKKKTCFRDKATATIRKAGLHQTQKEKFPPSKDPTLVTNNHLITFHDVAVNKTFQPAERKSAALSQLNELDHADATLWTDGSAKSGTRDGGAGGVLIIPNQPAAEFAKPAGRRCSSTRAELMAIFHGLELVKQSGLTMETMRLCTDSLSAVAIVKRGPIKASCSVSLAIWDLFQELDVNIQIVHVPAHVDLEYNEVADQHAARGSDMLQHNVAIDYSSAVASIKHFVTTESKIQIAATSSRTSTSANNYFHHVKPRKFESLSREAERNVRRMRTGHSPLLGVYAKRIGISSSETCPDCGSASDNLSHFLLHCPRLAQTRHRIFGCNPTLDKILNDPTLLANYLVKTGRISAPL